MWRAGVSRVSAWRAQRGQKRGEKRGSTSTWHLRAPVHILREVYSSECVSESRHIRDMRGGRRPGSYMPRLFAVRWLYGPSPGPHCTHIKYTLTHRAALGISLSRRHMPSKLSVSLPTSSPRDDGPSKPKTCATHAHAAHRLSDQSTPRQLLHLRITPACDVACVREGRVACVVRGASAWCGVRGEGCVVQGAWCRVRGAGCGVQGANVGGCREGRGERGQRGARRKR